MRHMIGRLAFVLLLVPIVLARPAAACVAFDGRAVPASMAQAAADTAEALCNIDSDRLNFASRIEVTLCAEEDEFVCKGEKGWTIIEVTSPSLSAIINNPAALRDAATAYGAAVAKALGGPPVRVSFFPLTVDGSAHARASFRLDYQGAKLSVTRLDKVTK